MGPDLLPSAELHAAMPQKRPRTALLLLAAAFVIVSTGGVVEYWLAGSTARQAAQPITSEIASQVAQKIRMPIGRDPALQREHIRVDASAHAIELSGSCSSPAARALVRRYAEQAGRVGSAGRKRRRQAAGDR